MKKLILTLFLLFSFYIFSMISIGEVESSTTTITLRDDSKNIELKNEIDSLKNELISLNHELDKLNQNTLIQTIELESEVTIPKTINYSDVQFAYYTSKEFNIPIRIFFRLMYKESRFKDNAQSEKGARGLMQLMPTTRKYFYEKIRVDTLNLTKNKEDIYIGANMINSLYLTWRNKGCSNDLSWKLALASYNAGIYKIKNKKIPEINETKDFVSFILKPHSNPKFLNDYKKKYEY